MCSIAGIVNSDNPQEAEKIVHSMNLVQRHRGPDGDGVRRIGCTVFGHRRLSIIDLAGGTQPMCNEDGTVWVTFNGEIYNYLPLKRELEARGHTFRTASDTEVLVHLYEEYGESMPSRLAGMFAFAIWDEKNQRLFMTRDRFGQKPLCYFVNGGELVFASEFEALRQHPGFPAELSPEAMADYLSMLYVPADRCIFRHVKKLLPGHSLTFADGTVKIQRYWHISYAQKLDISFDEATTQVRELVIKAVEKRLMSDVPSGTFLSGGVDSAIVTAVTASLRAGQGERTSAYIIGFDNPAYDERSAACAAAAFINKQCGNMLDHHVKTVDPSGFDIVENLLRNYGEPFADSSMIPTFLLSRFAGADIRMAISGDGADEIFAGYERYLAMRYTSYADFLPERVRAGVFSFASSLLPDSGERSRFGRIRRLCRAAAQPADRRYFAILDRCPAELRTLIFGERLSGCGAAPFDLDLTASDTAERCMETDIYTYLPGDILPKVDIASMANSLEVRSPFFDHELAEFTATLPMNFKLCGRSRKLILKAAFANMIPEETLNCRKRGFGIPLAQWSRGIWRDRMAEILFDSRLTADGWIDRRGLETLWQMHNSGRYDFSYLVWELTVLELFLRRISG